ncbi:MAG: hypothetical protein R3B99_27440 [Polyangiales bacterium]
MLHKLAAVVGNPPYIVVKDKALREPTAESSMFPRRQYSLAAPFCERFFQLAKKGGRVGQITANSFMKREFGKNSSKTTAEREPRLIVNTFRRLHPAGHGTPTVFLFGNHEAAQGTDVLAVSPNAGSRIRQKIRPRAWCGPRSFNVDEVGLERSSISVDGSTDNGSRVTRGCRWRWD